MKKKITSIFMILMMCALLLSSVNVYAAENTDANFANNTVGRVILRDCISNEDVAVSRIIKVDNSDTGYIYSDNNEYEKTETVGMTALAEAEYAEGEILVVTNDEISVQELESKDSVAEAEVTGDDTVLLTLEEDASMEEELAKLMEDDDIVYAQPNYLYSLDDCEVESVSTNDTQISQQFYLDQINIQEAWDDVLSEEHTKVKVAVLDTGARLDHEDLSDVIDKNLSVDVTGTTTGNYPKLEKDVVSHGTGVTGVIGAAAQNGKGIAGTASLGVADNEILDLFVVNVFRYVEYKDGEGESGYYCSTSDVIKGISYAVQQGARVINMSFGSKVTKGDSSDLLFQKAIKNAKEAGAVCVAAAGNSQTDDYSTPSDFDDVISVIALNTTNSNTQKASFSNYGASKDISAPGMNIITCSSGGVSSYSKMSGTSLATPIVSAVVAMMISVDPSLGFDEVYKFITSTATDVVYKSGSETAVEGFDVYTGYGMVNAAAAIEAVKLNKGKIDVDSVTQLKSVSSQSNGLKLSWNKVNNAVSYNLYYKRDGMEWKKFASVNTTEYTDTGVVSGRKYYYAVSAVDKFGNETLYDTTGTDACWLGGTKVSIKKYQSSGGVTLSWKSVKAAQGYDIFWRYPGETTWRYFKTTKNTSYYDNSAKSGKSYEYLIKAYIYHGKKYYYGYCADSLGASVSLVGTTSLSAAKPASNGVYLAWPKASNAIKYNLYYKKEGGSWKKFATTASTSYLDKTARAGVKYYYSVAAVDKDGYESSYNKTGTAAMFLAGTKVYIKKNGTTSVTLSWNKVSVADGYHIYWRYPNETKWRYFKSTTGTSYKDTSVKKGKSYEYLIVAYKKSGNKYFQDIGKIR